MKLYIKKDCQFCDQLVIPKNLDIPIIDVDKNYKGFYPPQFPLVQTDNHINIAGVETINELLVLLENAKAQRW